MFGRKTKPATSNVSCCSLKLYCGLVQRLHQISEMFVVESYFALKKKSGGKKCPSGEAPFPVGYPAVHNWHS